MCNPNLGLHPCINTKLEMCLSIEAVAIFTYLMSQVVTHGVALHAPMNKEIMFRSVLI